MPIYAYKCGSCGHAKDILRKISDPPLTACPACGAEAFTKQVTAAGFQLKGSGWYVTDFRNGNSGAAPAAAPADDAAKPADGSKPAEAAAKPAEAGASKSADAPAPAAAPKSDTPKSDAPKASGGGDASATR